MSCPDFKPGDLIYVVDGKWYAYTTRGSWGRCLGVEDRSVDGTIRVKWGRLTCSGEDHPCYNWAVHTNQICRLDNPPETPEEISALVDVLLRLKHLPNGEDQ